MAAQITALGVRPEIEAFDAGHLWFGKKLAEEGLIKPPFWCNYVWESRGARRMI